LSVSAAFSALQTPIDCNFTSTAATPSKSFGTSIRARSYVFANGHEIVRLVVKLRTAGRQLEFALLQFPDHRRCSILQGRQARHRGPQVSPIWPLDGAIAVSPQSQVQAGLSDATGVNSNSIVLTIGANPRSACRTRSLLIANGC